LYTDTSFADTTIGVGSSELVTSDQLNLSALYLNQTGPANTGTTETVSISTDSIAYDFYSADSPGIDPTSGEDTLLAPFDQRGVARPFGAGYDVGAFESGDTPDPEPSEEPEEESLADTGLPTNTGYLGLVGLGTAAILGGSAGILRRRKKA
jgi:LPXTG-motif cell wall-anchored protein